MSIRLTPSLINNFQNKTANLIPKNEEDNIKTVKNSEQEKSEIKVNPADEKISENTKNLVSSMILANQNMNMVALNSSVAEKTSEIFEPESSVAGDNTKNVEKNSSLHSEIVQQEKKAEEISQPTVEDILASIASEADEVGSEFIDEILKTSINGAVVNDNNYYIESAGDGEYTTGRNVLTNEKREVIKEKVIANLQQQYGTGYDIDVVVNEFGDANYSLTSTGIVHEKAVNVEVSSEEVPQEFDFLADLKKAEESGNWDSIEEKWLNQ